MMDKKERNKVVDKIKKLMALSESSNEHEAALALQRAKDLLDKYNLTNQDLIIQEVVEIEGYSSSHETIWIISLGNAISEYFNCEFLSKSGRMRGKREVRYSFVGLEIDGEIAKYAFDYVITTINRMRNIYAKGLHKKLSRSDKINLGRSYRLGLIKAVRNKLEVFADNHKEALAREGNNKSTLENQIIHVKKNAVRKYLNELGVRKEKIYSNIKDNSGYGAGLKDGQNINIRSGVGSSIPAQLCNPA